MGGILELTPEVRAALLDNHFLTQLAKPNVIIYDELPAVDPIVFDKLIGDVVLKAALATQGAPGLSVEDSWQHLLVSFNGAFSD